ncbi:MAG: ribonuclease [Actinomycetota bacterium]|nr:ribonuclease [Actinomycetota bacterium]
MASNDENIVTENIDTTDTPPDMAGSTLAPGAPVKKAAARKRAPRKATKKASTPQKAPAVVPDGLSESTPTTVTKAPADTAALTGMTAPSDAMPPSGATPPPTRKRAPRKATKKAAAPLEVAPAEAVPAQVDEIAVPAQVDEAAVPAQVDQAAEPEPEPESESVKTRSAVQTFGLLFQPPAPTEAPRRRRATAPAAAPVPEPAPTSQTPQENPSPEAVDQADDRPQDSAKGSDQSDDSEASGAPRRRRRGGKGRRGRASGEAGLDESANSAEAGTGSDSSESARSASTPDSASADDSSEDTADSGEGGESHRRTRRRRRGSAGEGDEQQSEPSTTTRVREPRPKRDEVTSVKGSTRLEAKKLRRREGREAGRRRTVITEAEFLARRESVERVMVVRHKEDRTQIGVLEDGVLVEHYVSRETNASLAGNVYLGRIQNVLPSMEAAFVDIGKGRNAVLYAGEVNWDAAGLDNRAKRIENALSSGQSVLVQVTKDPIGHKGARLTSQVSLPGRYLVYVPNGNMMGISRKLPDTERARLKKILREVVPENAGVIVRTAAEGASEEELRADVARLTATWNDIEAKSKSANAPALLHGEPDLTVRVIRDVFNEDFAKLVVSGDPAWDAVSGYVNTVAPDLADRIQKWTGEQDLLTHYRVDEQIAKAMDRKVWLPSGGTLVIDRTEAMTVVDVNTGKFVGSGGNLEETVTKNNIEAAEEVVRQLRLRDIGGIIVIDFIDMVLESNRDLVVRRLLECLGRDRTKHQVAEVTSLGLVQMTRKRVGAGLIEVFSQECEHCNGRGIIVSADPIDRPAGSDGSSGGGNSSSGAGGGSGSSGAGGGTGSGSSGSDASGGRGSRGRRARGTGRDTSVSVAPEPPAPTGGPTPAQIAATAHAAAVQAKAHVEQAGPSGEGDLFTKAEPAGEAAPSTRSDSAVEAAPSPRSEPAVEAGVSHGQEPLSAAAQPSNNTEPASAAQPSNNTEPAGGAEAPDGSEPSADEKVQQPQESPGAVATPPKSRRRSSRSAKSPAFSVPPSAEPLVKQPVVAQSAADRPQFERPAVTAEPSSVGEGTQVAQLTKAPEVRAPAGRARRKRPRVVAPAGPPRGAGQPHASGGEFGP